MPNPKDAHQPQNGPAGLQDEAAPEQEGWREFDAGTPWLSDRRYPAESGQTQPEADTDTDTAPAGPRPDDLLAAATEVLAGVEGLDSDAITLELQGDTLFLRGSVTTEADGRRAEAALLRITGIGRIDNQLDAAP